jgi:hypothetical protein
LASALGLKQQVFGPLIGDHIVNNFVDPALGLPAGRFAEGADVGASLAEFLEALAVRLLVGDQGDLRT